MIRPRPRVLITAPFDERVVRALSDSFEIVSYPSSLAGESLASLPAARELATVSVIIAELDQVDSATLAASPHLQLVIACRANPANVDVAACQARGIPVATTPARNADVTADFTLALLLATVRHTGQAEQWLRSGLWTKDNLFDPYERFQGMGLRGRTLGVVGAGAVGRRVIERAKGFGMNCVVHDPYLGVDDLAGAAEKLDLNELFSRSDIVTVHVPLSPQTVNLIGAEQLSLLRPSAYLINASRAAVINEGALVATLRSGAIAGAGLDVFYDEPLAAGSELFTFPTVTLTPHIAGASPDVVTEHSRQAAQTLVAFFDDAEQQ